MDRTSLRRRLVSFLAAALASALLLFPPAARASSHSDAPLIKQDPQANLTDVYAFVGTNRAGVKVLNVVVDVRPFSEPGDGAIYDRFADDALYSIHIANPKTGAAVLSYNFRFSPVSVLNGGHYKNVDTILSYGRGADAGGLPDAGPIMHVGDKHHNFVQTYTVTRVSGGASTILNGGMTLMCPPPNVGQRTTPLYNDADGRAVSGAASYATLDTYTKEAVFDLPSGETVFCGSRDDSFYMDIPGIFDLLNPRILSTDGKGVDGFKGYNVLCYAIQIPVSSLSGIPTLPTVGVYASVSRPRITLRTTVGAAVQAGPFIQVNRLANPFFNEAFVALKDKDKYNLARPTADAARFATYARSPELATLVNAVFGLTTATTGRTDLVGIYIPDVIKVDTSTDPVHLAGQTGFNRLSLFGGDFATKSGAATTIPAGWPNGRRLGDDVADIALTALVNGPSFTSPITIVGDNVTSNDATFNLVFPYSATPNSGTFNRKDPPAGPTP